MNLSNRPMRRDMMALFEKAAAAIWLKYRVIDLKRTDKKATKVRRIRRWFGETPSTRTSSVRCHEKPELKSKTIQGIFQVAGSEPVFIPSSTKG